MERFLLFLLIPAVLLIITLITMSLERHNSEKGVDERLKILKQRVGLLERNYAGKPNAELYTKEGLESLRFLERRIGLLEKDYDKKFNTKINVDQELGLKSVNSLKTQEIFLNNFKLNSTTLNIFIETNHEQVPQDKQFYKTFGSFGSPGLFEYVKKLPEHKRKRILVTGGAGFVGE